jgi:tetratricopeptide (TPR) repeat protein
MWRNALKIAIWGLILVIVLVAGLTLLLPKSTANVDAVETANRLASSGNYEKAIEIYEQLVRQGVNDSVVFFNLGNAYYSSGDTGNALAYYNRASQLDPRDPDIKANLELVRSQLIQLPTDDGSGFAGVLAGITDGWLSLNETAAISLALWFLLGLLILGLRTVSGSESQVRIRYAIYLVAFLLLVSGLSLAGRLIDRQANPQGVVLAPSLAVISQVEHISSANSYNMDAADSLGAEVLVSASSMV